MTHKIPPTLLAIVAFVALSLTCFPNHSFAAPVQLQPAAKQAQVKTVPPLPATKWRWTRSAKQSRSPLGVTRSPLVSNADLLTAAMIVLIPTVAIELTLFIGNLAAFSVNKRLLAWGIQGMAFSLLGGAVTLPWIILGINEGIAVSFIALHLALLGVSIANIIMGLRDKQQRARKVTFLPWGHVSPQGVAQGGLACVGYF